MTRFFAAPPDISGNTVRLSAEDAAHIRSLRMRPSELFVVCDGAGSDYICRLGTREGKPAALEEGSAIFGSGTASSSGSPIAEIVETRPSRGEPSVVCDVYIAFAKGDRLEYAVQKSIELGARDIILFPSERCVAAPGDMLKKITRLQRISLETAKQCGRGRVSEVTAAGSYDEAVRQAARAGLPLFFYECEEELHLKQALEQYCPVTTISIFTGPEGGFEPSEAALARSSGMHTVTLGPRILRCETAPAAVLAAVMFHTGNF